MKRGFSQLFLVLGVVAVMFAGLSGMASAQATPTQGQFAVKLVQQLGMATNIDQDQAIVLLSGRSIMPGTNPAAKWEKNEPATEKFVAQIQASLQILLKNVAMDLSIPPPPTLDLFIFTLPPTSQSITFPAAPGIYNNSSTPPPPPPAMPGNTTGAPPASLPAAAPSRPATPPTPAAPDAKSPAS